MSIDEASQAGPDPLQLLVSRVERLERELAECRSAGQIGRVEASARLGRLEAKSAALEQGQRRMRNLRPVT